MPQRRPLSDAEIKASQPPQAKYFDMGLEALLGALGIPAGDSRAQRGGELIGQAVAFGGPGMIKSLREGGEKVLRRTLEGGLRRSFEGKPLTDSVVAPGDILGLRGLKATNTPIPAEMADALAIAQQRWPRLFGHVMDIKEVDQAYPRSLGGTEQRSVAKLSDLSFNPKLHIEVGEDPVDTIGHELSHVADYIRGKDMRNDYDLASMRPGGYNVNPYEVRARFQGERFSDIVRAIKTEEALTGVRNPKLRVPLKRRQLGSDFGFDPKRDLP